MSRQSQLAQQFKSLKDSLSLSQVNEEEDDLPQLTEEQIDELREAFALFDVSGDGLVNVKEMQVIMRSLGQNPTEEEILDIMKEIDPKSEGETDFEGFLKLMRKKLNEGEMDEELFEAFKTYDK